MTLKTKYGGGPDFAGETASLDVQLIDNVPIKTRSWNFPLGWRGLAPRFIEQNFGSEDNNKSQ